MPKPLLVPIDKPEVAPLAISPRLRTQIVYFATAGGSGGAPLLDEGEYWFAPSDVARWLDDGVIELLSPLDTANMTEVELSEEQEVFLGWLAREGVSRVRIDER